MQLQEEVKSNPAVKKVCGPQECCCEKQCEIQSGAKK